MTDENVNKLLSCPLGIALQAMSLRVMKEDKLEDEFIFKFPEAEFTIHVKNKNKWVEES